MSKRKLNPRQEKFCQLFHDTGNATKSYEEAYQAATLTAGSNAYRLLQNDGIKKRLEELHGETQELCTMSRAELLDFYVEAIQTPVGSVTPGSRLCEEKTVSFRKGGDDETEEVEKIKAVSKIAAGREVARLCGYNEPEKKQIGLDDDLADVIRLATGAREE